MDVNEKRTKRFLRSISRRSATELSQLREIPETHAELDYFYDVMESVFIKNDPVEGIHSQAEKKRFIGVYCMLVPEELIYAAGAIPIRLCAGVFESSMLGEDHVPRDGCPLVKSSMGFSMNQAMKVFDLCDEVIVPTTCDAKRKLGEELSAYKQVWMLEVPHIKDAEFSKKIWLDQIYALKSKLEKNGSRKKITNKHLGKAIKNSARAQSEMRRLLDIRKRKFPVIWGRQAAAVVNSYAYAPVEDWTNALTQLNDHLSKSSTNASELAREDRPRIFISGSPFIFPNFKIPTLVEEMGGIVVCDESCTGDRYLYDPVGTTEKSLRDQMTGIASRYLAPCVCPSFTPNDDRLFTIQRMVSDFSVDGVLYHVLKGCVIYDFETQRVENVLKKSGTPLLRVETDYNPEDVEQLRTRIEAFIEMLKTKKRKKKV